VLVTVGVSEALDLALRAVLNPGDEVLYHEPCYVSYSRASRSRMARRCRRHAREDEFKLRPAALKAAITPRSKVLLLNFPTNPTGAVLTAAELEEIAAICREHNLLVITDEIYSELSYAEAHTSIASLPEMRERTIFLHGFSKAFAMTGFRIGYACAPAPLIDAMMRIHQYGILCAPIVSRRRRSKRCATARRHARHARAVPPATQFPRPRLPQNGPALLRAARRVLSLPSIKTTGKSSHDFAFGLLKAQQVAVVPGTRSAQRRGLRPMQLRHRHGQLQIAVERIAEFVGRNKFSE